ncbi:hypothetical protein J0910_24470 [Nocardiopsis sp. CNT-189]|uniref:hypothetical protein n=1 Tax=Nocardiopsis oceanisediminis TaxID=2816862 RepID=UPI003B33FD00
MSTALPGILALVLAVLSGKQSRLIYIGMLLTSLGLLCWTILNFAAYFRLMVDIGTAQIAASAAALVLLAGNNTRDFCL